MTEWQTAIWRRPTVMTTSPEATVAGFLAQASLSNFFNVRQQRLHPHARPHNLLPNNGIVSIVNRPTGPVGDSAVVAGFGSITTHPTRNPMLALAGGKANHIAATKGPPSKESSDSKKSAAIAEAGKGSGKPPPTHAAPVTRTTGPAPDDTLEALKDLSPGQLREELRNSWQRHRSLTTAKPARLAQRTVGCMQENRAVGSTSLSTKKNAFANTWLLWRRNSKKQNPK